jgi:hypothetical protein
MASGVQELNRVVFSGQDFATFSNETQDFFNTNYPDVYSDFVQNSMGTALLDIISFASMSLGFYINRRVTDLYLPTAVSPTNVSKLARLLAYKPQPASASSVPLNLTLTKGPYTFPVVIKKGFKFSGPNRSIWEFRDIADAVFEPGELTKKIDVYEGQTYTNVFVSDGKNNQTFSLTNVPSTKFLEGGSVVVVINNQTWTEEKVIPFSNTPSYEVNYTQAPPTIKFGDGVQGNVPPVGVEISVSYSVTTGLKGRVGSGQIAKAKDILVAQFNRIDLAVAQPDKSSGGSDPEDIRKTKVYAPKFYRSQDVCVTKSDYDTIANLFPGVVKADAQIIRGIENDITINTYLSDINDAVSGFGTDTAVSGAVLISGINSELYTINSSASGMATNLKNENTVVIFGVSTKLTDMEIAVNTQITNTELLIAGDIVTIDNDLGAIVSGLNSMQIEVDSRIANDQTAINSFLDQITNTVSGTGSPIVGLVAGYKSNIQSQVASLKAAVYSKIYTQISEVQTKQTDVLGATTDIASQMTALHSNALGAMTPYTTGIESDLTAYNLYVDSQVSGFTSGVASGFVNIENDFNQLVALFAGDTTGVTDTVNKSTAGLYDYLSIVLSDTCKANTVQVQVLAQDINLKYVTPTDALLGDLQRYLQDRADAVHTVICVTGINKVITASISVRVKVNDLAVASVVINKIKAAMYSSTQPLGLMVQREFGMSLYVWQIDKAIRDAVEEREVDYVNVRILGPSQYLDAGGNLIIGATQVIQGDSSTVIVEQI